jgi:hypothetical protein
MRAARSRAGMPLASSRARRFPAKTGSPSFTTGATAPTPMVSFVRFAKTTPHFPTCLYQAVDHKSRDRFPFPAKCAGYIKAYLIFMSYNYILLDRLGDRLYPSRDQQGTWLLIEFVPGAPWTEANSFTGRRQANSNPRCTGREGHVMAISARKKQAPHRKASKRRTEVSIGRSTPPPSRLPNRPPIRA